MRGGVRDYRSRGHGHDLAVVVPDEQLAYAVGGVGGLAAERIGCVGGLVPGGVVALPGGVGGCSGGLLGSVGAPGGEAGERLPPVPAGRGLPSAVGRLLVGRGACSHIRTIIRLCSRRYYFRRRKNRIIVITDNATSKQLPNGIINIIIAQIPIIRLIIIIRIIFISESASQIPDIIYRIADQTLTRQLFRMRTGIYDYRSSRNNSVIATISSCKNLSYHVLWIHGIVSSGFNISGHRLFMRRCELDERGRRDYGVAPELVADYQRAHPAVLGGQGLLPGVLGVPGRERGRGRELLGANGRMGHVRSGRDHEVPAVGIGHPYAPDHAVGGGHGLYLVGVGLPHGRVGSAEVAPGESRGVVGRGVGAVAVGRPGRIAGRLLMGGGELDERGRRDYGVAPELVADYQRAHPAVLGGQGLLPGVLGVPGRERGRGRELLGANGRMGHVRSGRDHEVPAVGIGHPYAPDHAVGGGHGLYLVGVGLPHGRVGSAEVAPGESRGVVGRGVGAVAVGRLGRRICMNYFRNSRNIFSTFRPIAMRIIFFATSKPRCQFIESIRKCILCRAITIFQPIQNSVVLIGSIICAPFFILSAFFTCRLSAKQVP